MTILSDLEKIKSKTAILGFLTLLLLITPGIGYIFIYANQLFLQLEISKLVLLSISLISPLVIINFLIVPSVDNDDTTKDTPFIYFVFSVMISGIITYLVLIISYFFKKDLYTAVKLISLIQLLLILSGIYESMKKKKLKSKSKISQQNKEISQS